MEGLEIFDPMGMAESLRHNEYNDINSAISEIVDNSIEAEAENIIIYPQEALSDDGVKIVRDIAIIDDGKGMDVETLQCCLVYGKSTSTGKGIGKFGVGLGQASLFAAPRVEVYSWQDSKCHMVYLDSEKMKKGEQKKIEPPVEASFTDDLAELMSQLRKINPKIEVSGTVVLWKNVDRISYKRLGVFYKNLSIELGEKFRYFIQDGCNIFFRKTLYDAFDKIKAVDPLFLMKDTKYNIDPQKPYEFTEAGNDSIFEPFVTEQTPNGIKEINVNMNGITSVITIKFSIVKQQYYYESIRGLSISSPGKSMVGNVLKKFEGISIVRARREIDFGRFDIYDSINDPANRWWGIEISFDPVLDDFFTVSNNKQHVEIKSRINNVDDDSEWNEIKQFLVGMIKALKAKNRFYYNEYKEESNGYENVEKVNITDSVIINSNSNHIIEEKKNDLFVLDLGDKVKGLDINYVEYLTDSCNENLEIIFIRNSATLNICKNSVLYHRFLSVESNKKIFENFINCLFIAKSELNRTSDQIGAINLIKEFINQLEKGKWRVNNE